jgi:hypothetical protein
LVVERWQYEPIWIAAKERPTNSLALTQGMGVSLDGSQKIESTPTFWSPGSVFLPTTGMGAGGENVRQFIGVASFGRASAGASQTGPIFSGRESFYQFDQI